jgi:hypothetical protein
MFQEQPGWMGRGAGHNRPGSAWSHEYQRMDRCQTPHLDVLVGGHGSLRTSKPLKTIGSYWPYATTLYDYLRRAMPFNAPQSLTPDEVYALTAWLLHQNGIVVEDVILDARVLPRIEMPNHNGFIPDPRPDVP